MLSLPEGERLQVRDELEDHLRSRVDDLLITGTEEQEAVRIAVAELGETAELAKVITHAHTRANPRRRMMNTALIITAIAGLSFGGLSLNSGTVPVQTTHADLRATLPTVEAGSDTEKTVELEIREVSMLDAVREIAGAFDREFVASPGSRELVRSSFGLNFGFGFEGSYTLDRALSMFDSVSPYDLHGHLMVADDDSVTLMTVDEYQRSMVMTEVHASPSWLISKGDITRYAESLYSLLSVKHDMGYSSIEVIGDAIVVAGPPNIQIEVRKMMHELDAVVEQRREAERNADQESKIRWKLETEQQRAEEEVLRSKRDAEIANNIAEIQHEFDQARKEMLTSKTRIRMINAEMTAVDEKRGTELGDSEVSAAQRASLQFARDEALLVIDEGEERYNYLRIRLLDSQYTHMFKGLE